MNRLSKWFASSSAEKAIERTTIVAICLIVAGTLVAITAAVVYLLFGLSTGWIADKAAAMFLIGVGGFVVAGSVAMARTILGE